MISAEDDPQAETQDWTFAMKVAEGQKQEASELEVQWGRVVSQVFRQEGRRGGQGEVGWEGGGGGWDEEVDEDGGGGGGAEEGGGGGAEEEEDGGGGGGEDEGGGRLSVVGGRPGGEVGGE